jgi:hypothetical protein
MEVILDLVDGTQACFALPVTVGRGKPTCLADGLASREQFVLDAVEDVQNVIRIEAVGINRKCALPAACTRVSSLPAS